MEYSKDLYAAINLATQWAQEDRHKLVGPDMFLSALITNRALDPLFDAVGLDTDRLEKDLGKTLSEIKPSLPSYETPQLSDGLKCILLKATIRAEDAGREIVTAPDALIALMTPMPDQKVYEFGSANYLLREQGVTREAVIAYYENGIKTPAKTQQPQAPAQAETQAKTILADPAERKKLVIGLEDRLKREVFFQDHAVKAVADSLKRAAAGLSNKEKPLGAFLFAGPTGVGKTELARQTASALGVQLVRFDMSEYMEKHSVSRLIGSPPGYVGSDQPGALFKAVKENPDAVILLDEVEKAHPDVLNVMLQVMDYGKLTDGKGNEADLRNAVLIMTTNAGARQVQAPGSIGFTNTIKGQNEEVDKDLSKKISSAVKDFFRPEFLNRLSSILVFNPISSECIAKAANKFIAVADEKLQLQNIRLSMSDAARDFVAAAGYNKEMGFRPMDMAVQTLVIDKLIDPILNGELNPGDTVKVDVDQDKKSLVFAFNKPEPENPMNPVLALPLKRDPKPAFKIDSAA